MNKRINKSYIFCVTLLIHGGVIANAEEKPKVTTSNDTYRETPAPSKRREMELARDALDNAIKDLDNKQQAQQEEKETAGNKTEVDITINTGSGSNTSVVNTANGSDTVSQAAASQYIVMIPRRSSGFYMGFGGVASGVISGVRLAQGSADGMIGRGTDTIVASFIGGGGMFRLGYESYVGRGYSAIELSGYIVADKSIGGGADLLYGGSLRGKLGVTNKTRNVAGYVIIGGRISQGSFNVGGEGYSTDTATQASFTTGLGMKIALSKHVDMFLEVVADGLLRDLNDGISLSRGNIAGIEYRNLMRIEGAIGFDIRF